MKQLSGMDAGFLYMETATSFGHVCSLSVYSRPDDPSFEPFEAFRSQLEARMHLIDPFRRRLVEVPMGLDRPFWILDPDFDLDFHVRHLGLPAPGSQAQLSEQVARLIGRPLDRSRPLWEAYVIEGLPDDDFAILTKVHHATIDGASGVELLTIMLDAEPHPPEHADTSLHPWPVDKVPSSNDVLRKAALHLAANPGRAARLGLRAMSEAATAVRGVEMASVIDAVRRRLPRGRPADTRDRPPTMPLRAAPRTPFNATITAHRWGVPLAHLHRRGFPHP